MARIRIPRATIDQPAISGSNYLEQTQAMRIPTEKLQKSVVSAVNWKINHDNKQEELRIENKRKKYVSSLQKETQIWLQKTTEREDFEDITPKQLQKKWDNYYNTTLKRYKNTIYKGDDAAWERGMGASFDTVMSHNREKFYLIKDKVSQVQTVTRIQDNIEDRKTPFAQLPAGAAIWSYRDFASKDIDADAKAGIAVGLNPNAILEQKENIEQLAWESQLTKTYRTKDSYGDEIVDYAEIKKWLKNTNNKEFAGETLNPDRRKKLEKWAITEAKKQKEEIDNKIATENEKLFVSTYEKVEAYDPADASTYITEDEIDKLNFQGAEGIKYKEQLKKLRRNHAQKKIKPDSVYDNYEATWNQVLDGKVTSITQEYVVGSQKYTILTNPNLSAADRKSMITYINNEKNNPAANTQTKSAISKFNRDVKDFETPVKGGELSKRTTGAAIAWSQFKAKKEKEMRQKLRDGKTIEEIFDPSNETYLFADIQLYVPSQKQQFEWQRNNLGPLGGVTKKQTDLNIIPKKPIRINTKEERDNLAPGTPYIGPDDKVRIAK